MVCVVLVDSGRLTSTLSAPRHVQYREDETTQTLPTANIMFDRRVVRGNTYAARILPADATQTQTKGPSPAST